MRYAMSKPMPTAARLSCAPASRRGMAGLSLIELMISIAIGLMILAAMVTIFANTSSSRNEIERSSRQIENGRYAVELLSNDLRLAGFYGELDVGTMAAPGALTDPCSTAIADWQSAIPLHLQGYNNGTGAPACVPAIKSNTDILVVRRARACTAGVSGCPVEKKGSPYLQVSLCDSESPTTPYVLDVLVHEDPAAVIPPYTLRIRNCTTPAAKRQYMVNIYFVSAYNGAGDTGDKIPTLKRMELTGSGFTETPLVEGIEFFKIAYGIDNDGDGVPDAYTADPANYTNWRNVVTAQLYILARNIDPSPGHTDTKTYTLGNDAAGNPFVVGPFSDAYRRHVFTSLVRIVNPAGRRDTP